MTTITDINSLQLVSSTSRKKSQNKETASEAGSDLSISTTSTLLSEAEDKAYSAPDIDEARVESIRQAIQNGEMAIDHQKLAQKMLEFELTLFDD
ncbi:flagellar biosynthesis anti-sigma factor FlgM [Endozoicomonas montiporae]|uniref:Negative regulator of flagellin synthesis n=1 Tax=Endozoicomonas montiporae CL-33 TaxID=570277 RepID=A0A142BC96_9GAMM|nr:flagellar biosynthesis anti-sigma factor FlgM [Endozoicomonas montiporae]AMO56372.1 negative regulator of flagellin synthesis (anti-sigma28 factor) [Endozoicomonas montiporae CL-33]